MREFFYHNRQWVYRIFPSLPYASWSLSSPLLSSFPLLRIVLLAIYSAFCRRLTKGAAQTELLEELCRDVRRGHEPHQGWSSLFFLRKIILDLQIGILFICKLKVATEKGGTYFKRYCSSSKFDILPIAIIVSLSCMLLMNSVEFFCSGEYPSDNIGRAIQSCSDCRGSPALSQIQHCKTISDFVLVWNILSFNVLLHFLIFKR